MTEAAISDEPDSNQPLPLVIGVAGHRHILPRHRDRCEQAASRVFRQLAQSLPSTPLVLVCSLTEGAEQLAVKAALDLQEQAGLKIELIVPLPMPADEFKQSFREEAARCEFDRLIACARRGFVLLDNEAHANAAIDGSQRVALYLAHYCQILLAFWDGQEGDEDMQADGVRQAVVLQLEGPPDSVDATGRPLDLPETGPVIHVITPHEPVPERESAFTSQTIFPRDVERLWSTRLLEGVLAPIRKRLGPAWLFHNVRTLSDRGRLEPGDSLTTRLRGPRAYLRILQRVETFNRDALLKRDFLEQEEPISAGFVIPRRKRHRLSPEARNELVRYTRADSLANLNRMRMERALSVLLVTAACWSILFYSQILLLNSPRVASLRGGDVQLLHFLLETGYLIAVAFGVVYWLWERHIPDWFWEHLPPRRFWERFKADFHSKYLDYRALAEGLRVQLFWRICGIAEQVSDHYLRKQKSELEWVRNGVLIGRIIDGPPPEPLAPERSLAIVLAHWVNDQRRYFSTKARWNHDRNRRMSHVGLGVMLLFLAVTVLREPISVQGVIVVMTLLSIFGGLAAAYARVHAFSEHAKQYGWMSVLFDNARRRLLPLVYADHLLRHGRVTQLAATRHKNAVRHGVWARAFNYYGPLWDQVFDRLAHAERSAEALALVHQEAHALLIELGKDALAENGDWVLLHRDRAVELPQT